MIEDPIQNKPKQERLDISVEIATPDDWQECKELRLLSITGPEGKMMGLTPDREVEERNKAEKEWRDETNSKLMFSVLARAGGRAIALGRAKHTEGLLWRVRNGYVKPEFRNLGIQQKMIALRLKEIIKRGGAQAVTGIRVENSTSIHNAEKFGFKIVEVDDGWNLMKTDLTDPEIIKKIDEGLNAR